jgi:hypothetical protein
LSASWTTTPGGLSIPGLSKTYEATLTNTGSLPVPISVCDFVSDTLDRDLSILYSIERWNLDTSRWVTFADFRERSCQPTPLSMISASVRTIWFWPKEQIQTGFIAIQGLDGLKLGDRLRFVLYPHVDAGIPTEEFVVDEVPDNTEIGLGLRH